MKPQTVQNEKEIENLLETAALTEEDKSEILAQIDIAVNRQDLPSPEELFKIKPQKRGIALPIMINILAICAIASALIITRWGFHNRQQQLSIDSRSFRGTEAKMIEELRRGDRQTIQDQQRIMASYQMELETLQTRITERESTLNRELEEALAREREAMKVLPLTSGEKQLRLESIRDELKAKKDQELALLRSEAQKKEVEIKREAEALRLERDRTEEALSRLTEEKREERLLTDQLVGGYRGVITALETGDYETASSQLTHLDRLIESEAFSNNPQLSKRRAVEKFFISTLSDRIEGEKILEEAPKEAPLNAQLSRARELIDRAAQDENVETAAETYRQAAELFPKIALTLDRYKNLKVQSAKPWTAKGEKALSRGDNEEALVSYRQAAGIITDIYGPEFSDVLNPMVEFQSKLVTEELSSRRDLESARQSLKQMEERLAALESAYGETQTALNESRTALEATVGWEKLLKEYGTMLAEVDPLMRKETPEAFKEVRRLFSEFWTREGVSPYMKEMAPVTVWLLSEQAESGRTEGRAETYAMIQKVLLYLGQESPDTELGEELKLAMDKDPMLRDTASRITSLVDLPGEESARRLVSLGSFRTTLVGAVTSRGNQLLIAEPLTQRWPDINQPVWIRRREEGLPDRIIARGTVAATASGRIEIKITETMAGPVEPLDLVYAEEREDS